MKVTPTGVYTEESLVLYKDICRLFGVTKPHDAKKKERWLEYINRLLDWGKTPNQIYNTIRYAVKRKKLHNKDLVSVRYSFIERLIAEDPKYNEYDIKIDGIIDRWNEFAALNDMSRVTKMDDFDKQNLRQRMLEGFNIAKVIAAVEEQPFMMGRNKLRRKVKLRWIIASRANYLKTINREFKEEK